MSEYICMQLQTGEQLLGVVEYENDVEICLNYPLEVKKILLTHGDYYTEELTAKPFMPMALERKFTFGKHHIICINQMHSSVVGFYVNLVNKYEKEMQDNYNKGFFDDQEEDLDYFVLEGNNTVN